MQVNWKIAGCAKDIVTGKYILQVQSDTLPSDELMQMLDGSDMEITKVKKKRSLDANAYFHLLVGKIADQLKISKPRCKNILLGRYGQREGVSVSVRADIEMLEREDIHTIATGYQQVYGVEHITYDVIRPSHTYDTKEMSILIAGTVDEAKDLGIETMTPDEIARITSHWRA